MSSFKIKTTANYTIDSNSINLTNAPPTNVGSTDLLARNAGTGELEVMPIGSIPSATNIYNADGSLTGDRLVTVGANSLTFLGGVLSNSVFNVDVNEINEQASDGIVLYGVTSAELKSDDATTVYGANSTTIGNVSNFGPVNIHAGLNGNLFIDQLVNTNNSNILYYNSANGRVTYDTPPSTSVDLENLGAGEVVLANPGVGVGPFNFKTLLAGTGITFTPTANDITISSPLLSYASFQYVSQSHAMLMADPITEATDVVGAFTIGPPPNWVSVGYGVQWTGPLGIFLFNCNGHGAAAVSGDIPYRFRVYTNGGFTPNRDNIVYYIGSPPNDSLFAFRTEILVVPTNAIISIGMGSSSLPSDQNFNFDATITLVQIA